MSLLKQKIEKVKQDLGYKYLSYMSVDLGYAHNYLGRVLSKGLEAKAEAKLIAKLDEFLELHKKELTHDFEGKALHKHIDDAMMISKSEYESMKKEIDYKNQVLDKRNAVLENSIVKVNELENQVKSLQKDFLNSDTEVGKLKEKLHLSDLYGREYWDKYFHQKRLNSIVLSEKYKISIWLAVSILIIVVMFAFGVLHFNGVV